MEDKIERFEWEDDDYIVKVLKINDVVKDILMELKENKEEK